MTIQYGNISDVWGDSKVHPNFTESNNQNSGGNDGAQFDAEDDDIPF